MAAIVYIKSFLWLVSLGGLGYGLMVLTAPSQEKIDAIKAKNKIYLSEEEKKKALFLERLQKATTEEPIYLRNSKDN